MDPYRSCGLFRALFDEAGEIEHADLFLAIEHFVDSGGDTHVHHIFQIFRGCASEIRVMFPTDNHVKI